MPTVEAKLIFGQLLNHSMFDYCGVTIDVDAHFRVLEQ